MNVLILKGQHFLIILQADNLDKEHLLISPWAENSLEFQKMVSQK